MFNKKLPDEIIVKTQKDFDSIPKNYKGTVYIEGGTYYDRIVVNYSFDEARIIVRGEAYAELRGSSHAVLWGSSHAVLWGSSHAVLWGSSHAVLRESSHAELWGSSHAVLWESSHAVLWGSSHAELRESSHAELRESSHAVLWGSSHAELRESSHAVLWESSHAVLRGSSHAVLWGSSHAVLRGSSHAKLFGEAMVSAKSAKEIICNGYNVVSLTKKAKQGMNIVCNKNSYIKIIPEFKATFTEFCKLYPVTIKNKKAIMYKAVHKNNEGQYYSDWSKDFIYQIGEVHTEKCAPKKSGSCSAGLHVAFKSWARSYGIGWNDFALLECELDVKDIIVCQDTDGKVRTPKLKVLREVPREEWYD